MVYPQLIPRIFTNLSPELSPTYSRTSAMAFRVGRSVGQPWDGHPSATAPGCGCEVRRWQRAGLLPAGGAIGCVTWNWGEELGEHKDVGRM